MANKKINELSVRTPSLSDLMLVGDPSTGYSYKATISSISTLLEANIALNDLSDVVITSVANGNLLAYNGTNWVNRTLGAYLGGTITQYVRGDGSLGDFSGSGGGGGASVSYYLNGSVNQGTFGGTTYYEMNKTPIAGAGTNFTINANGYIASFITDAGDPALLKIPGGNWNLEFYFSASSSGGTPSFYAELYKYDGTTFTLIASNSASPEGITNGTVNDAYFTALAVPETVLTLTDRLAIRVYVTHSGRTITLHTENSNLCQIITTFTTGLTALNNLTAQVQFFATGTSGTDFAISSTTATHTFNLPTASGSNRGALSSADWTTFNGKVGGSGTTNYVSKFTASGTIGNSQIFDNGTSVGVNTASPSASYLLDVNGAARIQNNSGTSLYIGSSTLVSTSTPALVNLGGSYGNNATGNVGNMKLVLVDVGATNKYGFGVDGIAGILESQSTFSFGWYNGNAATRTERMRLTAAGRLLIGTSTESTYELDVVGDIRSTLDANINGLTVGKGGGNVATSTAIGFEAMNSTVTGAGNVAVGYRAGKAITSGVYNAFVGWEAGISVNTGSYNYGFGMWAGRYLTSGVQNVLIGYSAGAALTTQNNNVFIGHSAGDATTAGNNVGIGFQTMQGNTTGTANTTLGTVAGKGITTGSGNTVIGADAGFAIATGSSNVLLGRYAGNALTSSTNTAIGAESLFSLTTGANNTALGYISGRYITAGTGNITSANSVYLGYDTRASADGNTNEIVIGYQAIGNGSNSVTLGNTSVTKTILQGNVGIGTTSPTTKITMFGQNPFFRVQGDGVSYYGGIEFYSSVSGSNRLNGSIQQYDANGLYIGAGTGMRLTFTINNGTEGMRLTQSGRLLIGTTTESTYILDANGTVRVQGTELRLDNATTGVINLYSNTPRVNFFSGGGYWVGRNSTTLEIVSGGTIIQYIGGNQAYQIDGSNGHLFRSAIAGSAVLARLDTGGSLSIGNGATAANASSILDLTSTTKGFLPPRMTGAQAEAIGTPAAGLMVYSTDGSGATITSLGWWGFNGTTWVKLN
jgi:hypothetical protein